MPETPIHPLTVASVNGTSAAALEARLRIFFTEQARLRELLEKTRAELDRVNSELMQFESEYCTDAARQEEYNRAIERILGFDPRIDLNEVEEILAGKRGYDMSEFLVELERATAATPSEGVNEQPSPTALQG
jgi:uncharacterized protein YhaN